VGLDGQASGPQTGPEVIDLHPAPADMERLVI
jgi:hypothetical protein